jgi:hypothetical protein
MRRRTNQNPQPWEDVDNNFSGATTQFAANTSHGNGTRLGTMEVTYYVVFKTQITA